MIARPGRRKRKLCCDVAPEVWVTFGVLVATNTPVIGTGGVVVDFEVAAIERRRVALFVVESESILIHLPSLDMP